MGHLLVSAAHKSSGKTTVTLGLCAALRARGRAIQPFKKGPDYIDPMWLGRAAGRPCYNLDFHTMPAEEIRATFARKLAGADLGVVEGNMGLYDGTDLEGGNSNAALAALLGSPVLLVVDGRGMSRTVAPLVLGLQQFSDEIRIAGVILNHVAGSRHEGKLRAAIEHFTDVPVLGALHRDPAIAIDERHLGLIPSNEDDEAERKLEYIGERVAAQVDLDGVTAVAGTATAPEPAVAEPAAARTDVRIGVARDAAFGFYYPDDLEHLEAAGAEVVPFNTLRDQTLPEVDGLFIGGGFPETLMAELEGNAAMRAAIRGAIEGGMPVYAECGGLMYLTRGLRWGDHRREMVGVLPAETVMHPRPVGRGYIRLRETGTGPWPETTAGAEFNAHEFHYSSLEEVEPGLSYAYEVTRGKGVTGHHDGIVYKNLLANYAHLRDVGDCHWTRRFVSFVRDHKQRSAGPAPAEAEHA
ncbi:MAG TPA: cobyrinate a,c-diamide synthase [Gammaproteobacteria bacterium]|nr:cobyrinate a,c-diamide synthase [Gammaproteobacteria bacterium]